MSLHDAVTEIVRTAEARLARLAPFRALVDTVASGGLVTVRRPEEATAGGEAYARLAGIALAPGDEVLVIPVAGTYVVLGKLQRTAPGEHVLDVPLRLAAALRTGGASPSVAPGSAAGTGAIARMRTGSTDHSGQLQIVTGSSGVSSGTIATLTFSASRPSADYDVFLMPTSAAAQALGLPRITGRSTSGFDVVVNTAPGTGQTLQWSYFVVET